ncbi:DUF4224 domain-containing protein [Collimonas sp.]|jgi:hypothetical protein|uniref:DUF4224 domain-containing protein n=1 Tax=Collimonas sp. TaxID=1963772 RepID=UPI002B977A50|nr:DUF4224 domain-containing protein [Collimonas sp.]HWX02483.1 DUF4224 domain-containing protein [Collimonas sp.]
MSTIPMSDDIFLRDCHVDELTGIKRGITINGKKKSKYQLQVEFLRTRGIAFIENARGRPVVVRSIIEGGRATAAPKTAWQPKVIGE